MAILSAYPLAAFGIIPNAIVADIIYQHEQQSGQQQSAMFYASRNFMMKAGISLANLIFPSLLLLGKSVENPLGLQVAAGLAFIFCIAGWIIFSRYQEV
jgi:GPH family glycoside/pentoside/hexuronide:cation symporter